MWAVSGFEIKESISASKWSANRIQCQMSETSPKCLVQSRFGYMPQQPPVTCPLLFGGANSNSISWLFSVQYCILTLRKEVLLAQMAGFRDEVTEALEETPNTDHSSATASHEAHAMLWAVISCDLVTRHANLSQEISNLQLSVLPWQFPSLFGERISFSCAQVWHRKMD